jgi:polysaccharide biosynthesis transport protein
MNIFQFLRILWAYRLIVLGFSAVAFIGAVAFVQIVSPRYEGQSRVMLDIVKPDPVTGQVISSPFVRAYTKTQIELVKDYQVAGRVVDNLGWATNPGVQAWYKNQKKEGDTTDFRQWAARQIVEGTEARLIEGSNILEIVYSSASPQRAAEVSEALRKAYVDLALQSRQEAAKRNAEWYETQAEKAKGLLLQSEETKANFERQTGIVLQDGQVDLESARLAALAGQGATPILSPAGQGSTPSESQLTQLEGELAQASKTLGPNHPMLQDMRRRRELLTAQVARERNAGGAAAAAAASAARASSGMLEAQKAKVMAQREQVERLRLMQADVNLRRDQYNQAATRAAQLRQEAEVASTGVTPLGAAVTPQAPVFPQKGLIVGMAVPVGAILGLMLGLLMELIGRRVRGPEDVALAVNAPVLGVIQSDRLKVRRSWRSFIPARPVASAMRPQSAKS